MCAHVCVPLGGLLPTLRTHSSHRWGSQSQCDTCEAYGPPMYRFPSAAACARVCAVPQEFNLVAPLFAEKRKPWKWTKVKCDNIRRHDFNEQHVRVYRPSCTVLRTVQCHRGSTDGTSASRLCWRGTASGQICRIYYSLYYSLYYSIYSLYYYIAMIHRSHSTARAVHSSPALCDPMLVMSPPSGGRST